MIIKLVNSAPTCNIARIVNAFKITAISERFSADTLYTVGYRYTRKTATVKRLITDTRYGLVIMFGRDYYFGYIIYINSNTRYRITFAVGI